MKKLSSISVFKIVLLSILCLYVNNIYVYIIAFIYLIIDLKYQSLLFIVCILSILIANNYKKDIIPIGIIDYCNDNYCIVNKVFYKTKLLNIENIKHGDILLFQIPYEINQYDNEINKNILFYGNTYSILFNNKLRNIINDRINSFSIDTQNILRQVFYNIYSYDDNSLNIGYGLMSYYLFNKIRKKNNILCIISIIVYSILFQFEFKFFLILIEIINDKYKFDKYIIFVIKIMFVSIINFKMLNNYSILFPLLFSLYSLLDFKISYKAYLLLIQSYIFAQINLFNTLFFKYMINSKIIIFILSLITLIIDKTEQVLLIYSSFISYINNIDIQIRGSISIFSLIIFIYLIKFLQMNNKYIQYIVLLLLLISPINNPLPHINFIDVDQGDAILIKYSLGASHILIDTGSKYSYRKLSKSLFNESVYEIDYLIITHNDEDHNGNIENLKRDFKIHNIIYKGESFYLNDIYFQYLYIEEFDNDNDNSLVYLVNIDNKNILFTGDISYDAERILIQKYNPLDIDIIKIGHHGSDTSSSEAFISTILAKYAIISTSGKYNHPNSKVLDILNKYGCKYFITKDSGNIKIYFTKVIDFIKTDKNEFVIIR